MFFNRKREKDLEDLDKHNRKVHKKLIDNEIKPSTFNHKSVKNKGLFDFNDDENDKNKRKWRLFSLLAAIAI